MLGAKISAAGEKSDQAKAQITGVFLVIGVVAKFIGSLVY